MKRVFTFLLAAVLTAGLWAQSPQKMSYQAVIRNSSNALVSSGTISMRISILQGSATGAVVYTETQTPTTNANGLVSIEIGGKAGFDAINWASGMYFIKTETDPTGGTNYTITGTSQLLSVPYALNAKTAESITGGITETDPVFKGSQAAVITANDITKLKNLSGVNTGDQDLRGLATTSSVKTALDLKVDKVNGKVLSTNDYTTAEKTKVAGIPPTLTIGQSYQGGIIFWLDATGQHGLIAATTDQSADAQWYNGTFTATNAVRDGIGAGMYNTERIIVNQGVGSYSAQLCTNYQGGGYGDWYLPSKYELKLLYLQASVVGVTSDYYWSSTEENDNYAWIQVIADGSQYQYHKHFTNAVRAIRAF